GNVGEVPTVIGYTEEQATQQLKEAGLALLGALAGAVAAAVAQPDAREAAVVTFVVTASGVSLFGVGGAFWGLVAGWLMLLLFRRRAAASPPAGSPEAEPAPPVPSRAG
ncbi:benzoate/H(+) symporter BenE family transporter, partial [Micromonospora chalcea]